MGGDEWVLLVVVVCLCVLVQNCNLSAVAPKLYFYKIRHKTPIYLHQYVYKCYKSDIYDPSNIFWLNFRNKNEIATHKNK